MPATLSRWAIEISGPRSVAGSAVGPIRTVRKRSATPSTNSVVARAVHDRPGGGGAVLAGVDQAAGHGSVDGRGQVGVIEDHERGLAAELEMDPLGVRGRGLEHGPADPGRAGEGHHVDIWMPQQDRAAVRARYRSAR